MKKTVFLFFSVFLFLIVFFFSSHAQEISKKNSDGGVPGACGQHQSKTTPSPLDGNGSLGQSFNQSACGLNYVAATARVETRYDPYTTAGNYGCGLPCTWSISGMPACIVPVRALVWANVSYQSGPPVATITLTNPASATNSYSSGPIGTSGPKCWGEAGTAVYRWDVTTSISGNGNYTFNFSGFGNPLWEIDGATIFIIYQDLSATYQGSLIFWDGAITDGQSGGSVSQTLGGFSVCNTPSTATAFSISSDHQDNIGSSHNSILNGGSYSFPNSFSNFEVANVSLFAGQSSSVFAQDGGGSDCWLWGMAGLYYQTTNCVTCTPSALAVTQSSTPAACGNSNGTATVNPSGGVAPYTYVWNPAVAGNTNSASGLPAGSYQVTIYDASGCSTVVTVVVNGTTAPAISTNLSPTGCTVVNGSATATPSGGTAPYTYLWSNGDQNQTANNLAAGTYTVIVTDANGCTALTVVTVTTINGPTTTSSVNANVPCNGGSNGSATTNPSGGTPAYTYTWSPSGGNSQTASGLTAGTYTVIITDTNGCSVVDTVSISQPPAIVLTTAQTNILCNGGNNGTATVAAAGGSGSYNYSWNTIPVQNTQTATGLSAGTYQCTVTDASGCTSLISVTITQPLPLAAAVVPTNVLCNGGSNGSATVNVSNGTAPYTYQWNTIPPQNTQTATGLSPGTYSVSITDANGCTTLSPVIISQPPPVALNISCGDSICSGDSTLLIASALGGSPAYTYLWMPVSQNGDTLSVSPTSSSSYTVSVMDANGCTSLTQICNVTVLPAANALFDTASSGTFGSTYSFNDLSSGGTSWSWNFGDNTAGSALQNPVHTFPGAGTYTVTQVVLNQYGCPDTFRLIIDVNEGILVPNVFTPDGDGSNDVWYIPNSGMKEFHVEIFDRWGLKVFETTADEIRWDGHSTSGKALNDGTYFYVLRAILKSGYSSMNFSRNGYITLLTKKK